VNEVLSR